MTKIEKIKKAGDAGWKAGVEILTLKKHPANALDDLKKELEKI